MVANTEAERRVSRRAPGRVQMAARWRETSLPRKLHSVAVLVSWRVQRPNAPVRRGGRRRGLCGKVEVQVSSRLANRSGSPPLPRLDLFAFSRLFLESSQMAGTLPCELRCSGMRRCNLDKPQPPVSIFRFAVEYAVHHPQGKISGFARHRGEKQILVRSNLALHRVNQHTWRSQIRISQALHQTKELGKRCARCR